MNNAFFTTNELDTKYVDGTPIKRSKIKKSKSSPTTMNGQRVHRQCYNIEGSGDYLTIDERYTIDKVVKDF